MNKKLHVRRNDMVEVITGNDRGQRARVLSAMPREGKVLVEGVNLVWKHVRPSRQHQRGGRIEKEAPMDASNVMLLCQNRECEKHDRPVRTRSAAAQDGTKQRVCVKCGHAIHAQE
jgi:large subunit ribosomal protein L24